MDGKPNRGPKGIISLDSGGDWSSPPWEPPQAAAAPPGETGGGGTVGPQEVQWISTPQTPDVYYGPGGQGTTNINITDPTASNYNQELAQAAMETQAAEAAAAVEAAAATQPEVKKPWYQFGPGIQGLPQYSQNVYQNLINQYLLGKPSGFWNSLKNMKGGLFGAGMNAIFGKEDLWREDGTPTLEGLKKLIGSENIQSLKAYDPEMYYAFTNPQTTGGLEDLANLPTTGDDAVTDPELRQKIFNARQELDRQQGDQGGGGGAGITGLPGIPPYTGGIEQPVDILPPDDVVLGYPMGDQVYTGVAPREGYQYTYDQEGRRYEIPIGGDQSGTTYGGNPFTWRPTETVQTPATITAPTPHDYSQWPQYPGYPTYGPAGGPIPNYINQGLGQAPQFDYWNQIARTFPGMR